MKLVIVGAGAVGQVFGKVAQRGGAEVLVYVRPKYAEAARAGFPMFDHGRRDERVMFEPAGVLTSPEELAAAAPDVVMLCMSSPALRSGDWIEELVSAVPDATIVGMQPGLGDPAYVREFTGEDRLVWSIIELISYQSPLPNGSGPGEGVAYWIPPMMPFPFSGPADRTEPVVALFRAGGVSAKVARDTAETTAVGSPIMLLYMAALEASGWSFANIRAERELLTLTNEAVFQAVAVSANDYGLKVPLWARLIRPWQVRLLSRVAKRLIPLDIEEYLQFHFTKVGDQTRQGMARWISLGDAAGLPTGAIVRLRDRLAALEDEPALAIAG
jgi:2-dehydropantoate 2-reductase